MHAKQEYNILESPRGKLRVQLRLISTPMFKGRYSNCMINYFTNHIYSEVLPDYCTLILIIVLITYLLYSFSTCIRRIKVSLSFASCEYASNTRLAALGFM